MIDPSELDIVRETLDARDREDYDPTDIRNPASMVGGTVRRMIREARHSLLRDGRPPQGRDAERIEDAIEHLAQSVRDSRAIRRGDKTPLLSQLAELGAMLSGAAAAMATA